MRPPIALTAEEVEQLLEVIESQRRMLLSILADAVKRAREEEEERRVGRKLAA